MNVEKTAFERHCSLLMLVMAAVQFLFVGAMALTNEGMIRVESVFFATIAVALLSLAFAILQMCSKKRRWSFPILSLIGSFLVMPVWVLTLQASMGLSIGDLGRNSYLTYYYRAFFADISLYKFFFFVGLLAFIGIVLARCVTNERARRTVGYFLAAITIALMLVMGVYVYFFWNTSGNREIFFGYAMVLAIFSISFLVGSAPYLRTLTAESSDEPRLQGNARRGLTVGLVILLVACYIVKSMLGKIGYAQIVAGHLFESLLLVFFYSYSPFIAVISALWRFFEIGLRLFCKKDAPVRGQLTAAFGAWILGVGALPVPLYVLAGSDEQMLQYGGYYTTSFVLSSFSVLSLLLVSAILPLFAVLFYRRWRDSLLTFTLSLLVVLPEYVTMVPYLTWILLIPCVVFIVVQLLKRRKQGNETA